MRKVVATELTSLDGVMEKPEEWAFSYSNDEMEQANASEMAASDALLLGRVIYEGLAAYLPNQARGTLMVGQRPTRRARVHGSSPGPGQREAPLRGGANQKALELVDLKTFATGVVYITYQLAQS